MACEVSSPGCYAADLSPHAGRGEAWLSPGRNSSTSSRAMGAVGKGFSSLHLSPAGRGRIAFAIRVRGTQASGKVVRINSRTPSRLSYTSVLVTRSTWKPQASSAAVRSRSYACSRLASCVTPSISTISLPSSVTKSTTYRSIGCCRRNFHRSNERLRSACQSRASALVCFDRNNLALARNFSIPLTRLLRSRPLPGGERCSTVFV